MSEILVDFLKGLFMNKEVVKFMNLENQLTLVKNHLKEWILLIGKEEEDCLRLLFK